MAKVIYYGDELQHWGILGMKWGIRRYQNPDGTLTEEGKLRYREDGTKRSNSEYKQLKRQNQIQKSKEVEKNKPKKISEMSDEELNNYINRKFNEKRAYELTRDVSQLTAKKESAVSKIIKNALTNSIAPALVNVGKQYLEKAIRNASGLNSESESQKLKREAQDWQNKANIAQSINKYNEAIKRAEKDGGK